ncbi:MAG: class I SAM-dependent methyltransferase [Anaeromyxobacteraceae bacterium]
MPVHDAARGFDTAADAYVRGRPEYPPAALAWVSRGLSLGPGRRILDLGAGTGKLSAALAATGAEVLALEPSAGMLAKARAPRLRGLRALAEALPLRDASLDGATAGTAFHWFDGDRAVPELRRALRPGGRAALLWNLRDVEVPWIAALGAIVNRGEAGVPRYRHGLWRRALLTAPGGFRLVEEAVFRHVHHLSLDQLVDRVTSVSFVAAAAPAARAAVLDEVRALVAAHPDTRGRDVLPLAYRTDAFLFERLPG